MSMVSSQARTWRGRPWGRAGSRPRSDRARATLLAVLAALSGAAAHAQALPPSSPGAYAAPAAPVQSGSPGAAPATGSGQGPAQNPSVLQEMQQSRQVPLAPPQAQAFPPGAGAAGAPGVPSPVAPLQQIQRAWDQPISSPGQVAPGVKRVLFEADGVVAVLTRQYMVTVIHLPPCEAIVNAWLGDGFTFEVLRARESPNVLTVTPRFAEGDTNLQVRGASGLTYNFYVRSADPKSELISDLAVHVDKPGMCLRADAAGGSDPLRPQGTVIVGQARERIGGGSADFARSIPFDPAKLRFDGFGVYVAKELDKVIAPDHVASDGVWTYLDYGDRSDRIPLPAVFLLTEGVDMRVNTELMGEHNQILAVKATGDITLKAGDAVVCIRTLAPQSGSPTAVVDRNLGRGFAARGGAAQPAGSFFERVFGRGPPPPTAASR